MAISFSRVSLILLAHVVFLFETTVAAENFIIPRAKSDEKEGRWFNFVTRPDLKAPKFDIRIYDEEALSPGYWFISPYTDADERSPGESWQGPHIYDSHGDLIWSGSQFVGRHKLWNFRVSEYDGTPMLTGLNQHHYAGWIMNNSYEVVKTVPADHWDMHEFRLVEGGTRALITWKEGRELSVERSKTMGFDGECKVFAMGLQEFDITVDPAKLLNTWVGVDHMPANEFVKQPEKIDKMCQHRMDINHFNSVDKFPDGDYLISSRHTSTIYKVSHTDGSIVWRLGGPMSDWILPTDGLFTRQHDARVHEVNATHTIISFFDNHFGFPGYSTKTKGHSRGLVVALLANDRKVEIVTKADHPLNQISGSRGSNQILPNGNLFLCWADKVRISEHSSNGSLIMHSNVRANIDSYRAYKFPWVGQPKHPPTVYSAASVAGDDIYTTVYVSWNGATEVARWVLYRSDGDGNGLKELKKEKRKGFETEIKWNGRPKYVVVEALDREDRPIGRSNVMRTLQADKHPQPDEHSKESGDSSTSSVWTSSIFTFGLGFAACAIICMAVWFATGFANRGRWPFQGTKYKAVGQEEREVWYEQGSEEGVDGDFELSDKT